MYFPQPSSMQRMRQEVHFQAESDGFEFIFFLLWLSFYTKRILPVQQFTHCKEEWRESKQTCSSSIWTQVADYISSD